jgi:hypothetical protein
MKLNMQAFVETLPVMGKGMLGIFVVTAVIILAMAMLKRFSKD